MEEYFVIKKKKIPERHETIFFIWMVALVSQLISLLLQYSYLQQPEGSIYNVN